MSTCTIRPAAPGDEELILSFIRALADYEHMSDQVVATPALLREWIFEKKKAEVIFAEAEGRAVGSGGAEASGVEASGVGVEELPPPPQAARESAMAPASKRAVSFFIRVPPKYKFVLSRARGAFPALFGLSTGARR